MGLFRIRGAGVTKYARPIVAGRERAAEGGFSVTELMIVMIIMFVVMAISVIQLQPTWQQIQANAGLDEVKSTLRQAREMSISQRRTIIVQFLTAASGTPCLPSGGVKNCIALTEMVVTPGNPPTQAAAAAPFQVTPIEHNVQFITYSGEPDTPDAFIGVAPTPPNGLYVGATSGAPASGLEFQSDGTFTNGNVNPVNLTLFLGETNIPTTARAVTILGNTGRVTWYQGTGKAWVRL
jgi:Tfp pilus assembly protein FimT